MAIINLTYDNVDGIIGEVYSIFSEERNAIMAEPVVPPEGAGDELMSWLVPREDNKKILEAMPDWCKPLQRQFYVKVDIITSDNSYTPIVRMPLTEQWYSFGYAYATPSISGTEAASWDGQILNLILKDTESGLPQGKATELVKQLFAIAKKHDDIAKKTEQAVSTMREFLGQHRTLQTALKECPAVMSYVPDWMKQELNRVPPKRTRRPPIPKGEKKEIDMSQLVTQATISKLNL